MKYFEETRRLLEHSNFLYVLLVNLEGNYEYINSNYAKAFAHISNDLLKEPYFITMHPDDIHICAEVSAMCFSQPEKLFPATIRKHDGRGGYIITNWEFKAIIDEDNQPIGVLCIGYDITRFEDEKKRLQEAEADNQKKKMQLKEIAFNQSHHIRAPLTNIIGLATILNKMDVDPNVKNICKMILESSEQLDNVIRGTVDLTYK